MVGTTLPAVLLDLRQSRCYDSVMSKGKTALGPTGAVDPITSSHRWRIILGGIVILVAALAVYHNCFSVPFLLDDVPSITRNPSIRHLWPIWNALSPPPASFVAGRPVVNFSLAVNYALGGTNVWGYHALNLAIHILASLTLFGIVRQTFLSPVLRKRFGASAIQLALAVAVLWMVHPLQTEAVTYISERCESLMGLFYLLTLYCFIRGTDTSKSASWFALSVIACLLGMGSKEVMVTAPVLVLLYDRTFVSESFREAWKRHRPLYIALGGTWILLSYLMLGLHQRGAGFGLGIAWWDYALIECRAVVQYLWLAIWPHPLVFDYGEFVAIRHMGEVAPYVVILVVLVSGVLVELKRQPAIGFIGAWFFMILAPTSSIVPIGGQPMAEHRMYLSLVAVVILAVLGIHKVMGQRGTVIFLALAAGLGFLTIRRNEVYRTELSILEDTVAECPRSGRAHSNLGRALLEAGQFPEAMTQCELALRMNPNNAEAHYNLGFILQRMGKVPEAVGEYEQTLRLKPEHADAHYNLGVALEKTGQEPKAITHYKQAIQFDPDNVEAHVNLGSAFLRTGKVSEAIEQYKQALRINPDYAEAYSNLGTIFQRLGKLPEAVVQYEQALRINPDYVEAHFNLGLALEKLGRPSEAIEHYQQALKLRPDFLPAVKALARLGIGQ
jgi:protein O-mannosyl-transferase